MAQGVQVPTGIAGFAMVCIGIVGRLIFLAIRPTGDHPMVVVSKLSHEPGLVALGTTALVLLAAGGAIGLWGAFRSSGKAWGIAALVAAAAALVGVFFLGIL